MTRIFFSFILLAFVLVGGQQKSPKIEKSDLRGPNRDGIYTEENLLKEPIFVQLH